MQYDPDLIDREVANYLPQVKEGKPFSEIKAELSAQGVEAHNIRMVVKELDRAKLSNHHKTGIHFDVLASFAATIGLLLVSFFFFIQGWVVVAVGGLFFSVGTLWVSIKKLKG